jgi:hypothetical protein
MTWRLHSAQPLVVREYQDAAGTFHGYLWERGRFRSIEAGGATGINNRGQTVGVAPIADPAPSPQPTATPMGRMA